MPASARGRAQRAPNGAAREPGTVSDTVSNLTLRSRCCAAAGSMVLAGKDEEEGAVWRSAITLMCEYAARPV